jgi:lipid-A-disaccharide synthase
VCSWPGSPIIVSRPEAKYDAFAASRVALAASGSVTLELALARLPMVTAYRLNPLTEKFLERALKVRQVNLVNLLLGEPLIAELLGPNCTPERLANTLAELITDERVRAEHRQGYDEAMRRLEAGGVSPSLRAADQILEIVAARRCGGCALTSY